MLKKELIWREILFQAIEEKKIEFTQKDLAKKLCVSLSTVFNALKIPRQGGAIKVTGKNFSVIDAEKFLYIWATQRNLEKEIIYKTYISENVSRIEGQMPAEIIFGGPSAYVLKYKDAPTDYAKVYVYAKEEYLAEIKKRFPEKKGEANLFVIKSDSYLEKFGKLTPDVQIFVDLWNMKDWYAKDFLNALKNKLFI
ncbi:MAG TPA: hypothetical protein DCS28_01670 [Candidatus Moranbacteria bacterium]|nr:hypothetical protein [Candidatus Moranbacteria bacterium]HAT74733.1 hypothetical protein [Candidatus Moranbacteria bacterium]